jgi:hypothetical protein
VSEREGEREKERGRGGAERGIERERVTQADLVRVL